jgi:hypothetical protein
MDRELDLLSTAHHEIGHALAARAGGLRVTHCRVWRSWLARDYEGECAIGTPTTTAPQWAIDAYGVFLHAGEVAEQLLLASHGIPNAADLAAASAEHDQQQWALYKPYSTLTDDQAWQAAVDLVHHYWQYLCDRADQLAHTGYLAGTRI